MTLWLLLLGSFCSGWMLDDSWWDMWLPIKGLKGSFIGGIPNANPLAGHFFFSWWRFAVPECHRQAHKAGPGKQHGSHSSTMDHPLVWVTKGQATPTSQPSSVKLSKNEYPWLISHFNTHLSTHTSMLLMKLLFVHSWEVQDLRNLFLSTLPFEQFQKFNLFHDDFKASFPFIWPHVLRPTGITCSRACCKTLGKAPRIEDHSGFFPHI